jgi:hypothetical protein
MGTTTNYGWEYPDVGSDVDTWGGIANTLYVAVDAQMFAKANLAGAAYTGEVRLSYTPTSLNSDSAGFRGAPSATVSVDYTLVMDDAGRSKIHGSATPHAWTIPPNSSVAFPIGTVVVLRVPNGMGAITVTRGAGVALRLGGNATDGNRTLAANGFASVFKEAADSWVIQGTGVS